MNLPDMRDIALDVDHPAFSREKDEDREYFSFDGGNVFSWNSKKVSEDQRKAMYQMIVDNVVKGILMPMQKLPDFYHNQIMAEAIKGNRNKSIVRYLELK